MKASVVVAVIIVLIAGSGFASQEKGGGNIASDKKMNLYDSSVMDAVLGSRRYIQYYINGLERWELSGSEGVTTNDQIDYNEQLENKKFLFMGVHNINEYLNTVGIESRFNAPCYEIDGTPAAGSIYANSPQDICVSLLVLTQQVPAHDFEAQVAALILHEMTHRMGGDEARAIAVQRQALAVFRHQNIQDIDRIFSRAWMNMSTPMRYIARLSSTTSKANQCLVAAQSKYAFDVNDSNFFVAGYNLIVDGFALMTKEQTEQYLRWRNDLANIYNFVCKGTEGDQQGSTTLKDDREVQTLVDAMIERLDNLNREVKRNFGKSWN